MKKRNKSRGILIALGLIILLLAGVLYNMVTWKEDYVVVKTTPASNTIGRVTALEKTGGTLELKSEDINGLIETLMRKEITAAGMTVDKMFVKVDKGVLNIYAPANFKGISLLLSCSGTLGYSGEKLIFIPGSFKAGKLNLPKSIVMNKLTKISTDDISVSAEGILIDKNAIPFELTNLGIKENIVAVDIAKLAAVIQTPSSNSNSKNPSTSSGGSTGGTVSSTQNMLKKANSQLGGVYDDVKSTKNKNIITRIQSTVSKMIQNPSYDYSADVKEVTAMKNGLNQAEKTELQDAILDNMDTSTIKQIRNTFGI